MWNKNYLRFVLLLFIAIFLTAQFKPGPDLRLSNSITSLWGNVAINASNAQTYAASSRPPRIFCVPANTYESEKWVNNNGHSKC